MKAYDLDQRQKIIKVAFNMLPARFMGNEVATVQSDGILISTSKRLKKAQFFAGANM